ncbi:MAG: hypothetical protein WC499_00225 [Patescibacteria group bacterium]
MERGEFLTPEQRGAMKKGETESKLDINFNALIKEREKLRKKKILDSLDLTFMLCPEEKEDKDLALDETLSDKEVEQGWPKVVERITKETKAFDELKETGIIYNLSQGIENGKYGVSLKFGKEDEGKNGKAHSSSPTIGWIKKRLGHPIVFVKNSAPPKREMWESIATYGSFMNGEYDYPNVKAVSTLDHELTHNLQWSNSGYESHHASQLSPITPFEAISLYTVLPNLLLILHSLVKYRREKPRFALEEIQAYKSDEMAGFKKWPSSRLIEHLEERYGFKDIDVLISGITEVERLKALGINDEEIGKLVKSANWDKETATFPSFESKIEELAKEKKLDIEDVDNLVLARRLQGEIEFEKARIIAQEELKKIAEKKFPKTDVFIDPLLRRRFKIRKNN